MEPDDSSNLSLCFGSRNTRKGTSERYSLSLLLISSFVLLTPDVCVSFVLFFPSNLLASLHGAFSSHSLHSIFHPQAATPDLPKSGAQRLPPDSSTKKVVEIQEVEEKLKEETLRKERVLSKKEEPGEMCRVGNMSVTEGFKAESMKTKMKEMVRTGSKSKRKKAATGQSDPTKQTSQEREFSVPKTDSPPTNVEITHSVNGTKKHEEAKTQIRVLENMSHKDNEEIQLTVSEGQKEAGDSLKQEVLKKPERREKAPGSDVAEEDSSENVLKTIRQNVQGREEVKPVDHLPTKNLPKSTSLSASSLSEVGPLFEETTETEPCRQTSVTAEEAEYVETLAETLSVHAHHSLQKLGFLSEDRNLRDADNKVRQQAAVEDDKQLQAALVPDKHVHIKGKTRPGFKSESDGYTAEQQTLKDKDDDRNGEDIHPLTPKQTGDKQPIITLTEEVKTQQHKTFPVSEKMSIKSSTEQDAPKRKVTKTEKHSAKTEEISAQKGLLTSKDQMSKSEARDQRRVPLEENEQRALKSVQITDAEDKLLKETETAEKEQSERKAAGPEAGTEATTEDMLSPVIEVVAIHPKQVVASNKIQVSESEATSPKTEKTSKKTEQILAAGKTATAKQKKPAINKQVKGKGLDPTLMNKTAEIDTSESETVSPQDRKLSKPQQTAVEPDQLKVSAVKDQTLKETQTTQHQIERQVSVTPLIDEVSSEEVSEKHAEIKCSELAAGEEVLHMSRQERGPKPDKQITPTFGTATHKTETVSPVKDGAAEKHPEYKESVTEHAALDDDISIAKTELASPQEPQHQLTESQDPEVKPDQLKVSTVKNQTFKVSPLKEKKSEQKQMKRNVSVTPVMDKTNKGTGASPEKLELAAGNKGLVSDGTPPVESISQKERQYKLAETEESADEQVPLKPITTGDELDEDSGKEKVIKDEESRAKVVPFKSKTVPQQKTRQEQTETNAEGIPEMEGKEKKLEDNSQEKDKEGPLTTKQQTKPGRREQTETKGSVTALGDKSSTEQTAKEIGSKMATVESLTLFDGTEIQQEQVKRNSVAPVMEVTPSETSEDLLSDISRRSSVKLGKENIVSGAATNKSHGPTSDQVTVMEETTNILYLKDRTKQAPLETKTTLSPDMELAKTDGVKKRDAPSEPVQNIKIQSEERQNNDNTSGIKCEDDQNRKKFKSQKEKQDMLGKCTTPPHKAVVVKDHDGNFTPLEEVELKQEEMEKFSLAPVMETASERSLIVNIGNVKSDSLQNIITPDELIKGITSREVNVQRFNDVSLKTDESPGDTIDAPVKALKTKVDKDKTEKLAERQERIERKASASSKPEVSAQSSLVDTPENLKAISKTTRVLTAEESKTRQKPSETETGVHPVTQVTHTQRSKAQSVTPLDGTETKQEHIEPTRSVVPLMEVKDGHATSDTLQKIVLPDKLVKGITRRNEVSPPRHSQTTDKVKKVQHESKPTTQTQSQLKAEDEVGQDAETVTGAQRLTTFDGIQSKTESVFLGGIPKVETKQEPIKQKASRTPDTDSTSERTLIVKEPDILLEAQQKNISSVNLAKDTSSRTKRVYESEGDSLKKDKTSTLNLHSPDQTEEIEVQESKVQKLSDRTINVSPAEHKTRAESKSEDLLPDKEKFGLIKEEVGGTRTETESHLSDKSAVMVGKLEPKEITGKDMAATVSPTEGTNKLEHTDSKAGETSETEVTSTGDRRLDRHTKRDRITLTREAMEQKETEGKCEEIYASQQIVEADIDWYKLTAKEPSVTDRTKLKMAETTTSPTDGNKTDAPEWTERDPRTGKSVLQPFLKADVRYIPPQEVQTLSKPEGEAQGLHPILETRFFSVEHVGPQDSSRGIKGDVLYVTEHMFGI